MDKHYTLIVKYHGGDDLVKHYTYRKSAIKAFHKFRDKITVNSVYFVDENNKADTFYYYDTH